MVGEVVGEPSMVALGDDPLESVGDKVEEVTKQFPFLRYAFLVLFSAGWASISFGSIESSFRT